MVNQQLNLLMNTMLHPQSGPTQTVNLSAGGAAFQAKEAIDLGKRIKLKLIFHPSLQGFIWSARIIMCRYLPKKDSEYPYRWAVKFFELPTDDEQWLQQHIIRQQVKPL